MTQSIDIPSILDEMARLYRRCRDLTRGALEDPNTPGRDSGDWIRERGEILSRLRILRDQLPIREKNGRMILTGVGPGESARVDQRLEAIRETVEALVEEDGRLVEKYQKERSLAEKEIERLQSGRTLIRAYAPYRGPASTLVNRRE
jgi:hypothetical protein